MENSLVSVNFEVFGRVQGVFFRKYTQKQAKLLGLKGFCLNTEQGTVQGKLQGTRSKVEEMKIWLKTVGSPSSKIEKAVFTNEEGISKFSTNDFVIKR